MIPIILCGGVGQRLWPVSRESTPKPFMRVGGKSLLQRTVARAAAIPGVSRCLVVTNASCWHQVLDETRDLSITVHSLLEPRPRNTAPAIALAALWVAENFGADETMLVLPADHLIEREAEFVQAALSAAAAAKAGDQLILFGINPTHPEPGFGYIEWGDPVGETRAHGVKRFVEKPSDDAAALMLESGNFVWNSGMFCFTAEAALEGLRRYSPKTLSTAQAAFRGAAAHEHGLTFSEASFAEFDDLSIDYALFERANNCAVIPCDIGWSDVGSWAAVADMHPVDEAGNAIDGRGLFVNSKGTYVSSGNRLVAAVGLEDVVIVDTPDAVLVCRKSASQQVRDVVRSLERSGDTAHKVHATVQRPWGSYSTLFEVRGYKVKRITVKPKQAISLQYHCHRAEHWVLIKGEAVLQIGEDEIQAVPGKAYFIPRGATHRMTNIGEYEVEFVEVQLGDYLGEDDIVRLADNYGRANE